MNNKSYRILSIEAKDLYNTMHRNDEINRQYSILSSDGQPNLKKFTNTFDWSLDSVKMEEVYQKIYRRKDFAFRVNKNWYTKNVICVNFRYSCKEFNTVGKNIYIRQGYTIKDCVFDDGVYIEGGRLIALQTNVEVREAVPQDILGDYFVFTDGHYEQQGKIPAIADKAEIRKYLYEYGFKCDGIEYVRYKRSGGSSRVGKCLFINKALADEMNRWSNCGLNIQEGQETDLAAWEAYISLSLSSVIDTVDIPLDSILVIQDYESIFEDEVVAVEINKNHLVSSEKKVSIKNSIWDGQSLMDISLFGKYKDKGMLLLRNRFFKSCCFNTNIQKWFSDNNISSVAQLNGFTLAKDISRIKLITTPSSIKYTKFDSLENWFKVVSPVFGIVKYEKQPFQFSGRLVQAHYQLFNTLQTSYEEMEQILEPSLKYISDIRKYPAVLRYDIQYPIDDDTGEWSSLNSKNEIIFKLLGINDRFSKTKLYYDFRDDLIKGKIRNLKRGHVLIEGNYSTIMGNGYEMLQASIGRFEGTSSLGVGNIHSTRFEYGKTLLCSRSPHVTVGNILLCTNVPNSKYDEYFNITNEIVCINSIGENILQRLNGADFDSDTMLITDHPLLIEIAKRNYANFKVPTNMTSSVKIKRYYTQQDKADLDIKTSVNKIGEIINLSQHLNSLMWQRLNNGESVDDCKQLYMDICKLAVLSNVEIDRAKKEFVINSSFEINALKEKYKISDNNKSVKPMFFKMITLENGFALSDKIKYKYFDTSMDYLQKIVSKFKFREGRSQKKSIIPFMDIVKKPESNIVQGYYYKQKEQIIQIIRSYKDERNRVFSDYDVMNKDEKETAWKKAGEIKQQCIDEIDKMSSSPSLMYIILKELDNPDYKDVSKFIFEVLFGKPNKAFFTMIKESREDIYILSQNPNGDISYYGYNFSLTPVVQTQNISVKAG